MFSWLKFCQTSSLEESFFHHALLLEEPRNNRKMVFHIHKTKDGKAHYETFSYSGNNDLTKVPLGNTNLTFIDVDDACRHYAQNSPFNLLTNNCQTWTKAVLNELQISSDINATNQETGCNCLYVISLSSNSSISAHTHEMQYS